MSDTVTQYRVFIATPGGLDDVRHAFREELRDYNETDALRRGVIFTPVGWEETLGGARRPQSLINEELRICDAFVLILWDRWGSPPDVEGQYSSGCEEEFELASKCLEDPDKPLSDLVVFFRAPDPRQIADPGPQLERVLAFKEDLEASKRHLFTVFDELNLFQRRLRRHLAAWVYAHEQRKPLGPSALIPLEPLPDRPQDDDVRRNPALEEAERLAGAGRLTEAEAIFARSIAGGSDPDAFNRYGHFLSHIGRLAQAEVMYERVLELAERAGEEWSGKGYGNLGLIYKTRGDLHRAEEMHHKALVIAERLGSRVGMAIQYSNLGVLYRERGELENAEEMHQKALVIAEQIGSRDIMAGQHSNLGVLYRKRGELERAEEMHQKALVIAEQIGNRGIMAASYASLGMLYRKRGELERAEEMHQKALVIAEQIGNRDFIAIQYANLGLIYEARGDLEHAKGVWSHSLALFVELGVPDRAAKVEGWLANLRDDEESLDPPE